MKKEAWSDAICPTSPFPLRHKLTHKGKEYGYKINATAS